MKTATWIQTCDPTTVEVIGAEGFDYCILDMEHSALNWQNIVGLMRGIPIGSQMQPLIRSKVIGMSSNSSVSRFGCCWCYSSYGRYS